MIYYEVVIEIDYCRAVFRFDDGASACEFAESALWHSVDNEDAMKVSMVSVLVKKGEK